MKRNGTRGRPTGQRWRVLWLLAAVGLSGMAGAAMITIGSAESWYGNAIHGLTPTGAGTQASPYVYAIPDGLTLTGTGILQFDPNPTDSQGTTIAPWVTLDFSAGTAGLQIDSGGRIDTNIGARGQSRGLLINLGDNSLTGSGDVYNSNVGRQDGSMRFTVQGGAAASVSLRNLDNHVNDPNGGSNNVSITVGGAIVLGSVNVADVATGGGASGNVTLRGGSVEVTNGVSAYAARTITNLYNDNGTVTIEALACPGFDANDGASNAMANTVTLGGTIDVEGNPNPSFNQGGGNVTIRGVVVTLGPTFTVDKEADSTLGIYAGAEPPFTGQHFFDSSTDPVAYSATLNVLYIPEPASLAMLAGAAGLLALRQRRS